MPMYKGEFQRAAKRRPIREVLPIPSLRRPPAGHHGGDGSGSAAFAAGPPPLPPEERQFFRWRGGESFALEHLKKYME
ncbi:unnamed protein product, partial [Cladocopium goreaui]